jgi:hypothetical protein
MLQTWMYSRSEWRRRASSSVGDSRGRALEAVYSQREESLLRVHILPLLRSEKLDEISVSDIAEL